MYRCTALHSAQSTLKSWHAVIRRCPFYFARSCPTIRPNFARPLLCPTIVARSSAENILPLTVVSTALFGVVIFFFQTSKTAQEFKGIEERPETLRKGEVSIMAGGPLPGRPGNLTKEQEEKLKEFWVAIFHVFGVPDHTNEDETSGPTAERQGGRVEALNAEKKSKKKKMAFFGKRYNDDITTDGTERITSIDGDDKFGQVKEYHKVLENQLPEELRQAFWSMVKHDNPDALLLRFLRARKWSVQNALIMLVATMHWRMQEMKVDDDIVKRGEGGAVEDSQSSNSGVKREGHDFLQQLRMGKSFLHGTDKEGRPICFVRVRLHKQGEQTEPSLERYTVYTIETARLLLSGNVDTAAIVFDMTDFSMANMDYAPVKFMIKCFEANYPESLGVVLVHKSPWIFYSIWKIIKGWLDPVVAGKVHFTKSIDELSEFIPLDHVTQELGGKDPWRYDFTPPVAGENVKMEDHTTRDRLLRERAQQIQDFELLTQQWLRDEDGDAVERRQALAEKLRTGYWKLDPYVRARTYCDRSGVIRPGGKIQFYPQSEETISTANGAPISAIHVDDDVD